MKAPRVVNKKQFFFLLYQFMLENRIQKDWFEASKKFKKFKKDDHDTRYINFDEYDDFKTHLMKSIDAYDSSGMYGYTIRGFFRWIPSSFPYNYRDYLGNITKWGIISDKWESKYYETFYI